MSELGEELGKGKVSGLTFQQITHLLHPITSKEIQENKVLRDPQAYTISYL